MEGAVVTFSSRIGGTGRIAAFGPEFVSIPGGLGDGCKSGEEAGETGSVTGGRRGKTVGPPVVDSEAGSGAILGGNRRIEATGIREGKTMRAVSRFATVGGESACSGRVGSAMRTVSFFGSAMGEQRAGSKMAQTPVRCHLLN
jgi:hypothetical protein